MRSQALVEMQDLHDGALIAENVSGRSELKTQGASPHRTRNADGLSRLSGGTIVMAAGGPHVFGGKGSQVRASSRPGPTSQGTTR
jgi:hypothetical protein